MTDAIRLIKSTALTDEEKKLLDGAPILDPDNLDDAIVGIVETEEGAAAVYAFEALVKCFMQDSSMDRDTAEEWIDYNTLRALPYFGPRAPWILEELDEEEAQAERDEENVVKMFGRSWWRLG